MDNYQIINTKTYNILFLRKMTENIPESFKNDMVKLLEKSNHLLINCSCLKSISEEWLRTFKTLHEQLEMGDRKLILVFLRPSLLAKVNPPDANFEFEVAPSLGFAIEILEGDKWTSDGANFIKAFVNATIKTIFVQCKTYCKRDYIFTKNQNQNEMEGPITGVINVSGYEVPFLTMVTFPEKTLMKLVTKVLGEEPESLEEASDMATELINIIYGQAKNILNKANANLRPEIPFLVKGTTFPGDDPAPNSTKITSDLSKGYNIIVNFDTDEGNFFIRNWFPFNFRVDMLR